jgi:hypothetical protein
MAAADVGDRIGMNPKLSRQLNSRLPIHPSAGNLGLLMKAKGRPPTLASQKHATYHTPRNTTLCEYLPYLL